MERLSRDITGQGTDFTGLERDIKQKRTDTNRLKEVLSVTHPLARCDRNFNDSIKVGGSCVFYRRWLEIGIYCVNALLNEDGYFVSLNQFRNKFSVQVDFLTFEGLLNSIILF